MKTKANIWTALEKLKWFAYSVKSRLYSLLGLAETNCALVSSRGILYSCDVFPRKPKSAARQVSAKCYERISENSTVYVQSSAMRFFIEEILPNISCSFVLVSGDCDTTVPRDIFDSNDDLSAFLSDRRIIHWYAQNCVLPCEKLSGIPIGLDYHTLKNSGYWWGRQISPKHQEKLINTLRTRVEFSERQNKCYANYHFTMTSRYSADRHEALNQVPRDLVRYEEEPVVRQVSWSNQAHFRFVISPHGNGLDCHRTWEALCLGCIPVVKTSPIDYLFVHLPVLIVEAWSDVSEELLNDTASRYSAEMNSFSYLKYLELDYWKGVINDGHGKAGRF